MNRIDIKTLSMAGLKRTATAVERKDSGWAEGAAARTLVRTSANPQAAHLENRA
jgi:hypothetical protein